MNKFEPSFKSLSTFECPKWYQDAKFGIWSHWGPQSVPMQGDWYARHMYIQGTPQNLHHCRTYGHPSKFGYKDICQLWKAEHFDPNELMDLYTRAGAKYFVAQAVHHDNFFNFPSKINRFNSTKMGPMKDICGMWKEAADQYKIPFGVSEHLGMSFSWFMTNKGADRFGKYKGIPYDGNDSEYADFYYNNHAYFEETSVPFGMGGAWNYPTDESFKQYWQASMKELIDLYHPQLLYSDGSLPFGGLHVGPLSDDHYKEGLETIAYLYNQSIDQHGSNQAVYNQKSLDPDIYNIGILDFERSLVDDITKNIWQTDTCFGGWYYDTRRKYKGADYIIELLVDIIAKNGLLLLNVLQLPDGSIDDELRYTLEELATWYAICGEGVYGTRPWKVFGEGDARAKNLKDGMPEEQVPYTSSDYRFTCKKDALYAFMMKSPTQNTTVIKSLTDINIDSVELLGHGPVAFIHTYGVLSIQLPNHLPTKYVNCFKIISQNTGEHYDNY